jgi:hypothetical protein
MDKKIIFIFGFLLLFSGCSTTGYEYVVDYYELMNTSMPAVDEIQITGKGVSPNETFTGVIDNTIYEGFGISDTLYSSWIVPSTIDTNESVFVNMKFFVETEEIGTTMKLRFSYTVFDGNKLVNTTSVDFISDDINVSTIPYEYFEVKVPLNNSLLENCQNNCVFNVMIQRVASTNDYSGDINLFSFIAEYNDFRPTMAYCH